MMPLPRSGALLALASTLVSLPLEASGGERRPAIHSIRTVARVHVSDGLEYDVVSVFHDRQRAALGFTYPDRSASYGIDGKYFWVFEGGAESEGEPLLESIVLGHQVHAQLLFFEELNGPLETTRVDCGGVVCVALAAPSGHRLLRELAGGRARELAWAREGASAVRLTFDDWREVEGVALPFAVTFDDDGRLFHYAYRQVELDRGSLDELRAPYAVLTDEQRLLRLHRLAMDAHFFEDPARMRGYFAADGVVVSRGEIVHSSAAESEAMMARIFASRDHRRYDDGVRPLVRVSADGTLGWVVAQVEAAGVLLDGAGDPAGPLEFEAAWISMFEKVGGDWKLVGNVSNFKPAPE